MSEIWKSIPGWQNFEVSSMGKIRRATASNRSEAGHILTPTIARNGYHRICLCQDGVQFAASVHVIVCTAFHGPKPPDKDHAAHCDGNKGNNASSNLAWKTVTENHQDKLLHGTVAFGARIARAKLSDSEVIAIRRDASLGVSRRELAQKYKVDKTNIGCIVRNETWRHLS